MKEKRAVFFSNCGLLFCCSQRRGGKNPSSDYYSALPIYGQTEEMPLSALLLLLLPLLFPC